LVKKSINQPIFNYLLRVSRKKDKMGSNKTLSFICPINS
jgi:hypothetical protein